MEGIIPDSDLEVFENYFEVGPDVNTTDEEGDDDDSFLDTSALDSTAFDISAKGSASTSQLRTYDFKNVRESEEIRDTFETNSYIGTNVETSEIAFEEFPLLKNGCKCERKCTERFSADELLHAHFCTTELNYYCGNHINHLNLFMQGALHALVKTGIRQNKNHAPKERKATYTEYKWQGISVCKEVFQFVNSVGERRLKNCKAHFLKEGVNEKVHGCVSSTPRLKYSFEERRKAVTFIMNFAQNNGLVLPGRLPGYRLRTDLLLLPSSMSKKYVYGKYLKMKTEMHLGRRIFYITWATFCRNVVIQRPRTDLCTICQHAVMSMGKLAGLPEAEKRAQCESSLNHLNVVDHERSYYRTVIENCRKNLPRLYLVERPLPCSWDRKMHISFDYAQQILFPCDAQQVGPTYFLAGYKVSLFGIAIEPLQKFVLFIIPESCTVGKGANAVISMLHHFFENFSAGEQTVHCHADNCTGQNKNRFMMQYLAWRILMKKHKKVLLSFMPAGHTKFAPDAYFGLIKRLLSLCSVHCLKELIEVAIKASTVPNSIIPVLVGLEDGTCFVPTYDWASFFQKAKTVPHITDYHHFVMSSDAPGEIRYREFEQSTEESTVILPSFDLQSSPEIVEPVGLSYDRKKYLYKMIRPYIRRRYRDLLCPKPPPNPEAELQAKRGRKSKVPNVLPASVPPPNPEVKVPAKRGRKPMPRNIPPPLAELSAKGKQKRKAANIVPPQTQPEPEGKPSTKRARKTKS